MPMMMQQLGDRLEKVCDTCRWWDRNGPEFYDPEEGRRRCRGGLPVMDEDEAAAWPWSLPTEGCGHWKEPEMVTLKCSNSKCGELAMGFAFNAGTDCPAPPILGAIVGCVGKLEVAS